MVAVINFWGKSLITLAKDLQEWTIMENKINWAVKIPLLAGLLDRNLVKFQSSPYYLLIKYVQNSEKKKSLSTRK